MNELHSRFGELLKLERERRGMALSTVSSELKVPEDTLIKIESGQADSLPPGPYLALFSKSYAEYLGIDYAKTVEAIREDLGESLEPVTPEDTQQGETQGKSDRPVPEFSTANTRKPRRQTGLVMGGGVIVVVFLAVIYLVFFEGERDLTSQNEVISPAPDSTNLWHDSTSDQYALQEFGDDSAGFSGSDSLRLTITAHDSSWATVLADDDTALFEMLAPERPYNVSASERLVVTFGVPEVVDVLLDGYPANLARARTGYISRVLIDHDSRDRFYIHQERDGTGDSVSSAEETGTTPR
ncbi:MAG: helix-turn-helix transcriptional regulator [bacterium]